jgi:threonine dehydratase
MGDEKNAQIFVGVQVAPGGEDRRELVEMLIEKDYLVTDLTENEMAKLHVRHMVGGPAPLDVENEVVYRFEFPERPGALMNFLNTLGNRWNISMFHYRNHGAAFGRVLVGMQVPIDDIANLENYLTELNYPYISETNNTAYRQFLASRRTSH